MRPHTLFISDLHLCSEQPFLFDQFVHFLEKIAKKADALYILGDFFNYWLGDDDISLFTQSVINCLKQAANDGLSVYLMVGNRDFLIGKSFCDQIGAVLIADPTVIELYGQRVLLMHGDSLCLEDRRHQWYRKCYTQPWVKRFLLSWPLSARKKLGEYLRKQSMAYQKHQPYQTLDVTDSAVKKVMKHWKVNCLVHGHTHHLGVHDMLDKIDGLENKRKRIVLGSWEFGPNALIWYQSGEYALQSFS